MNLVYYGIWAVWIGFTLVLYYFHRKMNHQINPKGKATYIGHRQRPGWSGPLPFYSFYCPTHGMVEDYPHGYWGPFKGTIPIKYNGVMSQLYCPLCEKESRGEANKRTKEE